MNPFRARNGKFRRPTVCEAAPLLAAMLRAKSEPHCRAERTKAAKRSAQRWAHVEAMRADMRGSGE